MQSPCKVDDIGELRSGFAFCALLLRDTYDAYRQCDGDRIFRNAKFEIILCDVSHHTKYRLNLWRMLALDTAILSPREAYEYRWNCSVNLQSGEGNNIPNDNLVELYVNAVKKRLRAQGSNVTFKAAREACDTIQIHQTLHDQMVKQTKAFLGSKKRPEVLKHKDIEVMANQLLESSFIQHRCNRQSPNFKNFVQPIQRVNLPKLCEWINKNKASATVLMAHAKCF